ncbi:hypothetical protein FCM35_KLT06604 [Carex littledalei]|uniref:DEP domain-containing protein n=1 Tax=Carex littledalei TaxID=544730 RepID=A0A833R0D5_9POAL|nr:hypothetical protein FCM35_KLT06604 [Carex littledalei]
MGEVALPHPLCPLPDQINQIPTVDPTNQSLPEKEKKEEATETEAMKHQKDSISTVDFIPSAEKNHKTEAVILPEHLPKPEAPPGLLTKTNSISHEEYHQMKRSTSAQIPSTVDMASIGRFIRDRSDVVSAAIARRISSLKETSNGTSITEIVLPDVKVIVKPPGKGPSTYFSMKGRVSFFSRSGCRDCTAVRSFFREIELPYVEINVDVFPEREKELLYRAGTNQVPQIFLNENHLGGLVVLNSLRNSGEFEKVVKSMTGKKCSDEAPGVPLYGFDHEEAEKENLDEMVGIVAVLRPRMPIQDRFVRMKLVRNCFTGAEMVDAIEQHLNLGRKKAEEIGKELLRRHFIHHVFREIDFEDGAQNLYRFLEHDIGVPKYFNFRASTNDNKPKSPNVIGRRLTKLMVAMLEAYASDDRCHVDYARIAASEEFRRYGILVRDLQRVDMETLSETERLCFFLNLYNAMVIHAVITIGQPGLIDRRAFFTDFQYIVGGYPYSLSTIKNGILRSNRRQPYSFVKPFSSADTRLKLMPKKMNPLIHFGLCNGNRSSPTVRFFTPDGVEVDLRQAAREFFQDGGIEIDFAKRTVYLSRIFKWYSADFGQDKVEVLHWVLNYLDSTKAGLLSHLLNDGGAVSISHQNFDWSLNC